MQPGTPRRKRKHGEGSKPRKVIRNGKVSWISEIMIGYRPDGKRNRRGVRAATRKECLAKIRAIKAQAGRDALQRLQEGTGHDELRQVLNDLTNVILCLDPSIVDKGLVLAIARQVATAAEGFVRRFAATRSTRDATPDASPHESGQLTN